MTTETGAIKYTYSYTPYGQLLSGETHGILFLYNGQYGVQSDDNGLYYMRARYYNIDIKRFINQDILTGSIDSSQSLNRYAYVEGNPVSYLDPFGLEKYRVDTSELHIIAGILGIVGGKLTATGLIVPGAVVTALANGFDIGLNISDSYYAILDEEYFAVLSSIGSIALDIIGIVTAGLASETYKEAEFIARMEGSRITGYEQYLTGKMSDLMDLGDKAGKGSLVGFLDPLYKEYIKIREYMEELFQSAK